MPEPIPKPEKRGPKPRRPIKRSRINPLKAYAGLKKLCGDTFALWVRIRDRNRCRLCRSNYMTQCAHLISRRYGACAYSGENAWCLCRDCHARWTNDPLGWDDLMERFHGPVEWKRRKDAARIHTKTDLSLLRMLLLRLLVEEARSHGAHGLDEQLTRILDRHERHEGRT